MISRTMHAQTRYSDTGYHVAAVRAVEDSRYGRANRGSQPEASYFSAPGTASVVANTPHPGGGYTTLPGGEPWSDPGAWRTW